jgi:hypothetical protein
MKNQLKSASEMRAYVDKTLRTYQIKKNYLSNRKSHLNSILKNYFDLIFF